MISVSPYAHAMGLEALMPLPCKHYQTCNISQGHEVTGIVPNCYRVKAMHRVLNILRIYLWVKVSMCCTVTEILVRQKNWSGGPIFLENWSAWTIFV